MITYKQYSSDSNNLFHSYHLEIARECGINFSRHEDLYRYKAAYNSGDIHLNSIPLEYWDRKALAHRSTIAAECKKRGGFYSLSTGVCVLKSAAKQAIFDMKDEVTA